MVRIVAPLILWLGAGAAAGAEATAVEFLGEAVVSRDPVGLEAPVGGLSGLSYDLERGVYFAVSDDGGRLGPARIYELRIGLVGGRLMADSVVVDEVLTLRRADGSVFPRDSIDPEGLARTPEGHWIVASEGHADSGVAAALFEFTSGGEWVGSLPLPRRFAPRKRSGIRHNQALESVTISPDGRWLFTATESALRQDGDAATVESGSASRLLRFDLAGRRLDATFVYRTEPIAEAPAGGQFAVNGLVELLALDEHRLLALERSFTVGRGNTVRLFGIDLTAATDVSSVRRLGRRRGLVEASKRLLVDATDLGVEPDNLEGMAFGPDLADGRRLLLLLADDNFNAEVQRSQFLAVALPRHLLGETGRKRR